MPSHAPPAPNSPTPSPESSMQLFHIGVEIGKLHSKTDRITHSLDHLILILSKFAHSPTPTSSHAPHHPPSTATESRMQTLMRSLHYAMPLAKFLLWAAPRILIAWGLAQGWLAAAWRWLLHLL